MFCLTLAIAAPARGAWSQRPPLQKSASFGAYTVNTYCDPNGNTKDAYYEILKNKKLVYRQAATDNGAKFAIGTLYDDDPDAKLVAMGRDITGSGQPDLLVSEWTGGANCCLVFHIFEIGPRFKELGPIDAEFGDQGPHFAPAKQGRGLQVQIYDWTFANWHSDFADSPAPKVILRYERGRFRVATDLMSTPTAEMKDLALKIQDIRNKTSDMRAASWPKAQLPPELWGTMLDLIYTGHRLLAWQFVEMAWPRQVAGKDAFVDDFITQLKHSPYWNSVSPMGT
jgi:hypothetical protein